LALNNRASLLGSYREFLWTPLPSPTFSLLTGQWLDFHQLADYHASRTAPFPRFSADDLEFFNADWYAEEEAIVEKNLLKWFIYTFDTFLIRLYFHLFNGSY
jgi:hypothetical protein